MADAEDLKSSGDFSSCGFDSHPGHHFFQLKMNQLGPSGVLRAYSVKGGWRALYAPSKRGCRIPLRFGQRSLW